MSNALEGEKVLQKERFGGWLVKISCFYLYLLEKLSTLTYGSLIWSSTSKSKLQRLNVLSKPLFAYYHRRPLMYYSYLDLLRPAFLTDQTWRTVIISTDVLDDHIKGKHSSVRLEEWSSQCPSIVKIFLKILLLENQLRVGLHPSTIL